VLAESIIDNADNIIDSADNITEVIREISEITTKICSRLSKMSKKLSGKKLLDVATISANNDREVGKMIADTFSKVSVVTVENSQTPSTHVEIISGMKIDRGFSSKYFITDQKKQECVLDNPYVLITDHEISNILNIEKVIAHVISSNKSLLIIGQLSASALNTLNLNVAQGKIKACNIIPPSFGYRSKDLLFDLSVSLGGTYFSEDTGDDLSVIEVRILVVLLGLLSTRT
jgi:chaperonin GroEL